MEKLGINIAKESDLPIMNAKEMAMKAVAMVNQDMPSPDSKQALKLFEQALNQDSMDGDDTADERLQNLSKDKRDGGEVAIIKSGPGELARIDPEEDEVTKQFYSGYMDRLAVLQRWTQEANSALADLDSDDEEEDAQKVRAETDNLSGNTSVNQTKMRALEDGPISSEAIHDSKQLNAANFKDHLDSVRLGSADTGSVADDAIHK